MKQSTQFQSENVLMSVLGHLVLIAIMVFSFSVVVERAKLVTPNRVEIIEIDLKNVRVTKDETKLYNTEAPRQKEDKKTDENAGSKEIIQNEKSELKQPAMVEDESKNAI